jgi:hypothetical protein
MRDDIKYLGLKHFVDILKDAGINPGNTIYKRLSSKAIRFESLEGNVYIIYCNTIVFKREDGRITLDSDGWQGNTTKKWMNYGFDAYKKGYFINQKNWKWFINNRLTGEQLEYWDGITI